MALGKDKWSNKPGTGKSSLLAIRTRGNPVIVEKVKRRPVSQTPAASTKGATGQHADHDLPGQGPLADTTATVTLGSESAVDNSREAGAEVAVRQLADHGLSDDAPKPAPQNTAGEDAAVSPDVGVPVVDGGTERAGGNFSLGKNQFYLHDGEVSSVSTYASAINDHWQRGVDAFMNIARVCADANARLTTAQKRELIQALPFGDTAFSKFVQIGIDTRLYAPDMQRRLPPYYTTTYAVTLLTDEELKQAIAENVIYPDMKREELERWRREQKKSGEEARSAEQAANAPSITASEVVKNDDPSLPAQPEPASQSEPQPTETTTCSPDTFPRVASPAIALPGDAGILAAAERDPLSAEDQRAFDALNAAWDRASDLVRALFRARIGA